MALQWTFWISLIIFMLSWFFLKPVRKIFIRKYPKKLTQLDETTFYDQFESLMPQGKEQERWKEIIDKAWQTRDFEIELYWKRANYFWLFQIPAFTAYFALTKVESGSTVNYTSELFVIICLGIIFSTAWLLINKGSKSWQRHWEEYIDLLESKYYGPLYRTVSNERTYSVTKINEIVSAAFVATWFMLALSFGINSNYFTFNFKITSLNIVIAYSITVTILCLLSMLFGYGRGYFKDREIKMFRRSHHFKNP